MSVRLPCLRFCILVNVPLSILQFSSFQSKWYHSNLVQFVFLFFTIQGSSGLVSFNCFLLVLSLFYTVAVCFPEIWTSSAISFKNRCHRTWHMMIFRVFSWLCSGTHDGQVQKMLQYTLFQRIYQRCVCHCSSLKSAMLKQCSVQIQIQTHIEFVGQLECSFQSLISCCFQ